MTIKRLSSGYWHVRLDMNRFIQWRVGVSPVLSDGFGWVSQSDIDAANLLIEAAGAKDAEG